jgi:hypothetical protein
MTVSDASDAPVRHAKRPSRRVRLRRTVVLLVVLAVLGGIGAGAVYGWNLIRGHRTVADKCQVVGQTTGAAYVMDPEQLSNASTIADVAMRHGLPQQAVIVALATVMQESKLLNLSYGDRDSVGLFQQRPSQGWGPKDQLLDPIYASGKFFDALVKVRSWQTLPVAVAAQAVQRSGFPDAYAPWQQRATAMAAALTGTTSGQLSCRVAHPGLDPKAGAPGTATTLNSPGEVTTSSNPTPLDGTVSALTTGLAADLVVTSPAVASVGTKSRTITVSGLGAVASGDDIAAKHRSATVAAWALAHVRYGITRVVVGDQEWRADKLSWATVRDAAAPGTVVITVALR